MDSKKSFRFFIVGILTCLLFPSHVFASDLLLSPYYIPENTELKELTSLNQKMYANWTYTYNDTVEYKDVTATMDALNTTLKKLISSSPQNAYLGSWISDNENFRRFLKIDEEQGTQRRIQKLQLEKIENNTENKILSDRLGDLDVWRKAVVDNPLIDPYTRWQRTSEYEKIKQKIYESGNSESVQFWNTKKKMQNDISHAWFEEKNEEKTNRLMDELLTLAKKYRTKLLAKDSKEKNTFELNDVNGVINFYEYNVEFTISPTLVKRLDALDSYEEKIKNTIKMSGEKKGRLLLDEAFVVAAKILSDYPSKTLKESYEYELETKGIYDYTNEMVFHLLFGRMIELKKLDKKNPYQKTWNTFVATYQNPIGETENIRPLFEGGHIVWFDEKNVTMATLYERFLQALNATRENSLPGERKFLDIVERYTGFIQESVVLRDENSLLLEQIDKKKTLLYNLRDMKEIPSVVENEQSKILVEEISELIKKRKELNKDRSALDLSKLDQELSVIQYENGDLSQFVVRNKFPQWTRFKEFPERERTFVVALNAGDTVKAKQLYQTLLKDSEQLKMALTPAFELYTDRWSANRGPSIIDSPFDQILFLPLYYTIKSYEATYPFLKQ